MDRKNDWIQLLRALAAIMVLLFHMRPHLETSGILKSRAGLFDFFFSGADVFFVLSGHVLYRAAQNPVSAPGWQKIIDSLLLSPMVLSWQDRLV